MDRKDAFNLMLDRVDPDKRDEAYARLAAVDTRAEKLEIMREYGVAVTPEAILGDDWEADARELTDDELAQVAGGFNWERDCNCEP